MWYDWNSLRSILEVNGIQRRMRAWYIYWAPVSGANRYIKKKQYYKLQTIKKENLQEIKEGQNTV